jgi:hypothetical protein
LSRKRVDSGSEAYNSGNLKSGHHGDLEGGNMVGCRKAIIPEAPVQSRCFGKKKANNFPLTLTVYPYRERVGVRMA